VTDFYKKCPYFVTKKPIIYPYFVSAEVDLVFTLQNKVIPIEIKSGPTGSLRSLHQFIEASDHPFAVRIYGGEFKVEETKTPRGKPYRLLNLPYYLGTLIKEYKEWFVLENA